MSKILFLRGVTTKTCETLTNKFNRLLLCDIETDITANNNVVYESLPASFTGILTWPISTNIKCKWCTQNITGRPIFVPGKRVCDIVVGGFCTFNCARAELINNVEFESIRWESGEQLNELYRIFNGKKVGHIVPAPSKSELKEYGGYLSRTQFTKKLRELAQLDH